MEGGDDKGTQMRREGVCVCVVLGGYPHADATSILITNSLTRQTPTSPHTHPRPAATHTHAHTHFHVLSLLSVP